MESKNKAIEKLIDLVYTIKNEDWALFRSDKAKANAYSESAKQRQVNFGFISKEEFVSSYNLSVEEKATIKIVNGNNAPLGKVTYSFVEEKVIPSYWQMRVS